MSEEMIDSTSAESQETTTVVEPAADTENQTVDYWNEDAPLDEDTPEEPTVAQEDEQQEESAVDKIPEYITEGLGSLEEPIVIKYKGKIFDIADKDKIRDLMERGMGATVKNQELADMKRDMLKQQNPEMTDTEISNIESSTEVEAIAQKITGSSYVDAFKDVITGLPDDITSQLRSDPRMLEGLRVDVESGLATKIMKHADRFMALDGMSFQEAYMKGGKMIADSAKTREDTIAKLTSSPDTNNNVRVEKQDVWSMSDADYKALMSTERR